MQFANEGQTEMSVLEGLMHQLALLVDGRYTLSLISRGRKRSLIPREILSLDHRSGSSR